MKFLTTLRQRVSRAWGALRSHPIDSPKWLLELLGVRETAAGVDVTPQNAMELASVFGCVKVLAETVGCLPLHLYQRLERGKKRADTHPLHRLLHYSPNPEMSSMQWRETMMAHLALWGNHYSEIEVDKLDRPKALWPLNPSRVRMHRNKTTRKLWYEVYLPDGGTAQLPCERVLHVKGLSMNGIEGLSPLGYARETIALGIAATEYGARFFSNNGRPGGVFEHPGKLTDQAHTRLKKSLEEQHAGLENSHRIAILEEGMKWSAMGVPPEDAQFLVTRQFQVAEVARFYRMPLHKIQEMTRSTNNNIEQQALEFLSDTIQPWIVRIEQEIWMKLLNPEEQARYFVEFMVEGLLRGDIEKRYRSYSLGRQWGWLSPNDIREKENMNPIEKGGDEYLSPLNMKPLGAEPEPNEDTPGTDPEKQEPRRFPHLRNGHKETTYAG